MTTAARPAAVVVILATPSADATILLVNRSFVSNGTIMSSPHFIYTQFFTASHIIVTEEEPAIVLPGYANPLTEQAEDITLYCSFAQLNDNVYCDGHGPDEVAEQLADSITASARMPLTLDVTEAGGLECNCLWYCMERVIGEDTNECCLRKGGVYPAGFCKEKASCFSNQSFLQEDKYRLLNRYLFLLAMQYDFYLYFHEEKASDEAALYYSGLQVPVVFNLAKLVYRSMKEG